MIIKIAGYGKYLPERIITNDEMAAFVDTSDEWIFSRTGIKKRHIAADNQLTSDLATAALREALDDAQLESSSLDGIILATTTPDLVCPATATRIQHNIGMRHGFAFDISAVCSGFIYALSVGYAMLRSGQANIIAIIGAEVMSRIINWHDRNTCVLFGDGAGAVILKKITTEHGVKNSNGILGVQIFSDGAFIDILKVDGGVAKGNLEAKLSMNGQEVFKNGIDKMASAVINLTNSLGVSSQDIDWVIPHQANNRMFSLIADRLQVNLSKIVSVVSDYANTSAASIPIAFNDYVKSGKIEANQLVALTAVGSGLTWGSALIRI